MATTSMRINRERSDRILATRSALSILFLGCKHCRRVSR
jgi:hypothetical protein